jgi:hypothetical protein
MRSHADIISEAGGPAKFAAAIGVSVDNSKAWKRLNSIPSPYWTVIVASGLAALDELANAVAKVLPDGRVVHLRATESGLTNDESLTTACGAAARA